MLQTTSENFKHTCFVGTWDWGLVFGPKIGKNKVIFGEIVKIEMFMM